MAIDKIGNKYADNNGTYTPINKTIKKVDEVIDALNDITDGSGTETFENITVTDTANIDTVETDTINESTAATGVTIDGVLIKDGTVKTGAGTVSLPAIKVGQDNTGLFQGDTDQLNVTVAGTNVAIFSADGIVVNNDVSIGGVITFTRTSITQTGTISTAVSIGNTQSGIITTVSSTLAADASASFDVTCGLLTVNSVVTATGGTSGTGKVLVEVTNVTTNTATLRITNVGTASFNAALKIYLFINP